MTSARSPSLPSRQRDDEEGQVLRTYGPCDVAFPGDVFEKHNSAGAEQNLLPSSDLDFPSSTQRYDILSVRRLVPILNFPLRQAEELSFRDLNCLRRFCFGIDRRGREFDFHFVLVGLTVRTGVEPYDGHGLMLLSGEVCTRGYNDEAYNEGQNCFARR